MLGPALAHAQASDLLGSWTGVLAAGSQSVRLRFLITSEEAATL